MGNYNVVALRELQTVEQVLDHARKSGLSHVIVAGITEGGENYFRVTGVSTLKELVWVDFCIHDSMQRMVNGKP